VIPMGEVDQKARNAGGAQDAPGQHRGCGGVRERGVAGVGVGQFGDGIMSAINFKLDVSWRTPPGGDRVVVTFDGKFLDYQW